MCESTHPVFIQLTTHSYSTNSRFVTNGPFIEICRNDSIVPMSAAYAIARWASSYECNYLYLAGPMFSGADAVLAALINSLQGAFDVRFYLDKPGDFDCKQVIRVINYNVEVTTPPISHSILQFYAEYSGPIPTPVQLGAFLLAVGDYDGPSFIFRCVNSNGIVCNSDDEKCQVCSIPMWEFCPFMLQLLYEIEDESSDEGICV